MSAAAHAASRHIRPWLAVTDHYVKAPLILIQDRNLSSNDKLVYLQLAASSQGNTWVRPNARSIAATLGLCVNTVQRCLDNLTAAGYLEEDKTYRNGQGKCYYFLDRLTRGEPSLVPALLRTQDPETPAAPPAADAQPTPWPPSPPPPNPEPRPAAANPAAPAVTAEWMSAAMHQYMSQDGDRPCPPPEPEEVESALRCTGGAPETAIAAVLKGCWKGFQRPCDPTGPRAYTWFAGVFRRKFSRLQAVEPPGLRRKPPQPAAHAGPQCPLAPFAAELLAQLNNRVGGGG